MERTDKAMSDNEWKRPQDCLPADGQDVDWMDSAGNINKGRYQGRLWFLRDMSMYVYYVPTFWRAA